MNKIKIGFFDVEKGIGFKRITFIRACWRLIEAAAGLTLHASTGLAGHGCRPVTLSQLKGAAIHHAKTLAG